MLGFFLAFRERIIGEYSIIFSETGGDASSNTNQTFGEKWGYFGLMYRLCNADISKLEQITKLNLLEAFTWLSYETDLASLKKVNINGNT